MTTKVADNKLQSEVNVLGGFTCMKNRPYIILIAAVDRVGNLKCVAQILIGDSGTMALCITSDCVKEYTDEKSQSVATCKSHRYYILCRRNDVYTAASVPYPSVTRRCGGETATLNIVYNDSAFWHRRFILKYVKNCTDRSNKTLQMCSPIFVVFLLLNFGCKKMNKIIVVGKKSAPSAL